MAVGIVIGNLDLLGWDVGPPWPDLPLEFLAELGLVLLLFQAGLDSSLAQMRKVVGRAGRVAGIGVVVPIALGAGLMELWMPETSMKHHQDQMGATTSLLSILLHKNSSVTRPNTHQTS